MMNATAAQNTTPCPGCGSIEVAGELVCEGSLAASALATWCPVCLRWLGWQSGRSRRWRHLVNAPTVAPPVVALVMHLAEHGIDLYVEPDGVVVVKQTRRTGPLVRSIKSMVAAAAPALRRMLWRDDYPDLRSRDVCGWNRE